MRKTILVTGSSAGLGRAIVQKFAAAGWNVVATMRTPEKDTALTASDNVLVTRLDVQDSSSIAAAITAGIEKFGKIDAVVNNAAHGVYGPFELATEAQVQQQFDVNVFGVMRVMWAILPHFRANSAGMIINISSQGGRITFPVASLYHSTKFAIEGLSESIAYELGALNIIVKLVEPGAISTGFDQAATLTGQPGITDYDSYVQAFLAIWGSQNPERSTPEQVAEAVYRAATDGSRQLRYIAGKDAEEVIGIRQSKTDQGYVDWMLAHWAPASV